MFIVDRLRQWNAGRIIKNESLKIEKMALLSLQNVSIAFGGPPILDALSLQIEKGQRICLLGRNGTGKSTLMKIISGELAPDDGLVLKDSGARVAYFSQEIAQNLDGSVFEIIATGLGHRGELMANYHREEISATPNQALLEKYQNELTAHKGWSVLHEIEKIASRMDLDQDAKYTALSGGQKRRVILAKSLVSNPELLLLDEPTNHLDIASISWLEDFLVGLGKTTLFVTHDRMLLRRLATRIIELDRGALVDWSCDYDTFLERKQANLDAEETAWKHFDKKMAQEEIWIRKGIKARRTRNEGRVRVLLKMRQERKERRLRDGSATMRITSSDPSGHIVLEAKDVSFGYDEKLLINELSTVLTRGDRIGIVGPNGSGKTTLVNLLLGKLKPQTGTISLGTNLSITYFDQLREKLDEEKNVWENVLPNGDTVTVNGQSKHIIGYLQDFLFTPERAKTPVRNLSGGERSRLLLARLFTRATNFLVMDEPTNDLDVETLELLEELLVNFKGTVLLICHDREFLNNVVTSALVFTDDGRLIESVGGWDDWLKSADTRGGKKIGKKKDFLETKKANRRKKLTFKEIRELAECPAKIETLEKEQADLNERMADPEVYCDNKKIAKIQARLDELEVSLAEAYARWEYLEQKEKQFAESN